MHELGIALEVIESIESRIGDQRVRLVVLEVGLLTAVLPDALRFCFDLASEGQLTEGAELKIIEVPGRVRCVDCRNEFSLDRPFGRCSCGRTDLEWLSGEELTIKEIEVV